jgi:hypothetical protein
MNGSFFLLRMLLPLTGIAPLAVTATAPRHRTTEFLPRHSSLELQSITGDLLLWLVALSFVKMQIPTQLHV